MEEEGEGITSQHKMGGNKRKNTEIFVNKISGLIWNAILDQVMDPRETGKGCAPKDSLCHDGGLGEKKSLF